MFLPWLQSESSELLRLPWWQQVRLPDITLDDVGLAFGVLGLVPLAHAAGKGLSNRWHVQRVAKAVEAQRKAGRDAFQNVLPRNVKIDGKRWPRTNSEAVITSVVSGKGGVGKSALALALSERYSIDHRVLLVDLDLHNRGLSSLLLPRIATPPGTDVFREMERFVKTCLAKEKSVRGDEKEDYGLSRLSRINLGGMIQSDYHVMVNSFLGRGGALKVRPLHALRLEDTKTRSKSPPGYVGASQRFFLPGVRPKHGFLLSDVSRLDVSETFLFVKCLAEWAHQSLNVSRVVIDCHGSQDMLTVGTILASDHLVVVATPDIGSVEGTADLVSFTSEVVRDVRCHPRSYSLVLNQCRSRGDRLTKEVNALYRSLLVSGESPSNEGVLDAVVLEYSDRIRKAVQDYRMPSLCRVKDLWPAVDHIVEQTLVHVEEQAHGQPAPEAGKIEPAPRSQKGMKLGEILVEMSKLTTENVSQVLRAQKSSRRMFGETAVELGFCSTWDVEQALKAQTTPA